LPRYSDGAREGTCCGDADAQVVRRDRVRCRAALFAADVGVENGKLLSAYKTS
jgi:hypothetical protein